MMTNENALATPDYRDKVIALMEKNETLEQLVWARQARHWAIWWAI